MRNGREQEEMRGEIEEEVHTTGLGPHQSVQVP